MCAPLAAHRPELPAMVARSPSGGQCGGAVAGVGVGLASGLAATPLL